ncbi:MAG: sialate O-acetylesterase, partial [Phycisphaeraceae bacterium]
MLVLIAFPVAAELKVHGIFASNMVIQRDKPIKVWGWAEPTTQVDVQLGDQKDLSVAHRASGAWQVSFNPRTASNDPIKLTVRAGDETIEYTNIVIGDVWVMNGQSNMAWDLAKTNERDIEAIQADLPNLRLLTIQNNEQQELQKDLPDDKLGEKWQVCTRETANGISAIGYAFGSRIHRATGVPIGIIDNSRGGASIESLVPERKLAEHPLTKRYADYVKQREAEFSIDDWLANQLERWEKKVESEKKKGTPDNKLPKKPTKDDIRSWNIPGMSPSDAGSCYNGMFGAFIGYNIKGVLFHQGFNNALGNNCRPKRYRVMMKQMIEGWREDFNDPNLAVGVIGFCAGGNAQNDYNFESLLRSNGSYIRE